jgi:hypothetical protein
MIGEADQAQPQVAAAQDRRCPCRLLVRAGADRGDLGRLQVGHCVQQRLWPVVQGVVVGERHRDDTELGETLGSDRGRPKEERLIPLGEPFAARRDTTLEVEHESVRVRDPFGNLGGDQRGSRIGDQRLGHPPAQHRVAGERERRGHVTPHPSRTRPRGARRPHV